MSDHLGHSPWGVIHTDPFTARLALDGFKEQPAVIQMRLEGQVRARSITDLNRSKTSLIGRRWRPSCAGTMMRERGPVAQSSLQK